MSEYVFKTDEPIEGCAKCPMRYKQGSAWCQFLLKWTPTNEETERHPDCPLVELPSHGRLIDADELLNWKNITCVDTGWWETDYDCVKKKIILKAPTILEASEVK